MHMKLPTALPIRVWLGLALVAVIGVPLAAMTVVGALALHGVFTAPDYESLRTDVVHDVGEWHDPAWQADIMRRIAQANMHVVLLDSSERIIFSDMPGMPSASPAGTDPSDVLRLVPPPTIAPVPATPSTAPKESIVSTVVQPITRVVVAQDGQQVGTALFVVNTARTVEPRARHFTPFDYVFFELTGPRRVPIAFTGLIAFLVMTLLAAWLLGRALLRPLAALGEATRHVAAGNLDFDLPATRISEVAAVGAAFRVMGGALRESLYRQAEVEGERRIFITAIVHDLRTPLFALRGYLEGLTTGVARSPQRAAEYLAVCREKVAVLDHLVADLFTYARMEYLEQAPERQMLELGDVLRRVAEGLHPRCEERGVTLTLDGPDTPCSFEGDSHLITRAVENLLDNALRHTPPGGRICIQWGGTASEWHFSVADTGSGIAPADLPHLFAPMYRGESSRNRQTGGAGLGLTIARRVLVAHGGDLTAANQPNSGAIFTALLPSTDHRRAVTNSQPVTQDDEQATRSAPTPVPV